MTDHFAIAPLGALDLDRAAALHAESFTPFGEHVWTRQDLAELVALPGVAGLLLQVDGHDAGFAVCQVAADEAELLTLAVRPAHRRQGGARRLLAAIIDHVRKRGARTLFLEVGVDNPAARSLYESQGFRAVGERRAYYQRGQAPPADGLVMRLNLI
jgi:[ribosomal protein S18]-alanine N-acetyltransferase